MKKLVILGSTGSIGLNTLAIVDEFPEEFEIIGLTAKKNISLLKKQVEKYNPAIVGVREEEAGLELKKSLKNFKGKIALGLPGIIEVASLKEVDLVVVGIAGIEGLVPTWEAIRAKKDLALANKEALVMAGKLIMAEVKKQGINLFPVDSEHSAIQQCLFREKSSTVKRIILTASGGPFLNYSFEELAKVTIEEAIRHPNWRMGKKISIDSATLLNKGLEIIEAHWLFQLPPEKIEVVIHPQSIIHSLVEYIDGTLFAQLSPPDMRIPIQYALFGRERRATSFKKLDLLKISALTFIQPDLEKFPALRYAYQALRIGGTMPVVLSAAGEAAVELFIQKKINFLEISQIVKEAMKNHQVILEPTLPEILRIARTVKKTIFRKFS